MKKISVIKIKEISVAKSVTKYYPLLHLNCLYTIFKHTYKYSYFIHANQQ